MKYVEAKVKFIRKNQQRLKTAPDKIMYAIASMTLDASYPSIPKSENGGDTRKTTKAAGVRKASDGNYMIGSYTDYAKYPYTIEDRISNVNWTEHGSESHWFEHIWKRKGQKIKMEAIRRNEIK